MDGTIYSCKVIYARGWIIKSMRSVGIYVRALNSAQCMIKLVLTGWSKLIKISTCVTHSCNASLPHLLGTPLPRLTLQNNRKKTITEQNLSKRHTDMLLHHESTLTDVQLWYINNPPSNSRHAPRAHLSSDNALCSKSYQNTALGKGPNVLPTCFDHLFCVISYFSSIKTSEH